MDCRGRALSFDDRSHYTKIAVALQETIGLMEQVDVAIAESPAPW